MLEVVLESLFDVLLDFRSSFLFRFLKVKHQTRMIRVGLVGLFSVKVLSTRMKQFYQLRDPQYHVRVKHNVHTFPKHVVSVDLALILPLHAIWR